MYDHVLVGIDGSPDAARAVESAARLAHAHSAGLTIVYAFNPRQRIPELTPALQEEFLWLRSSGTRAEAVVSAAVDRARAVACGGLEVHGRVEPGAPVAVLAAVSKEVRSDVAVVGNADVRRLRVHRSIGHALARRVTCDVVIVDTIRHGGQRGDLRSVA
jgi:nucleotide-binding universal stress UspA family protein